MENGSPVCLLTQKEVRKQMFQGHCEMALGVPVALIPMTVDCPPVAHKASCVARVSVARSI